MRRQHRTHNNCRRARYKGSAGFSMLEFVISMGITVVSLTSFVSATSTSAHGFSHIRERMTAIEIGDLVTEEFLIRDGADRGLDLGEHIQYFNRSRRRTDRRHAFVTVRSTITAFEQVPGIRRLKIDIVWEEEGTYKHMSWTTYRD